MKMKLWPFLLAVGCAIIGVGGSKFVDYMSEPEPPPSPEAQLLIDSMNDVKGWHRSENYLISNNLGMHVNEYGCVYMGSDIHQSRHLLSDSVPLPRSDRHYIKKAYKRNYERVSLQPFVDRLVKSAKEDLAKKEAEANKP